MSPRHIRCNTALAIPAYLSPIWRETLKARLQYNARTFTSAPIHTFVQWRVNSLLYFLGGIDTKHVLTPSDRSGQHPHKDARGQSVVQVSGMNYTTGSVLLSNLFRENATHGIYIPQLKHGGFDTEESDKKSYKKCIFLSFFPKKSVVL